MNGLLDRVASVLERRFLLVAFLPVLIFVVAVATLAAVLFGDVHRLLAGWQSLPVSVQILGTLALLAVVWMLGGFLDSQRRNLTQLFEGYTLVRWAGWAAQPFIDWHRERKRSITFDADPAGPRYFREEHWVLYPKSVDNILPTRLGNVMRAAEDYSEERFKADYLIVWPRLAHVCSVRFVQDYEASRANVDFLLVVCFLSVAFGVVGGGMAASAGSIMVFLVVTVGSLGLGWLAYTSAVSAAIEFGEQIRASVDLFRINLLEQLRYPLPEDTEDEQAHWEEFSRTLKDREERETSYVHPAARVAESDPLPPS
jgi:hypothetical protein